jgi:glyoxylase-like metal-dependent hydrolase (beta-lactamase superfamily II)
MTTFKIGAATVTRIEETYEPNFDAQIFFADWKPELVAPHLNWMVPNHFDPQTGMLKLSVHSWLITIGGRTILIDTCVGNHKPRPARPKWHMMETRYLDRLAAAGVRPEQVDMVMCTHLHVDHVGWNTRLDNGRWVPTFPNARYVFSQEDYDYYGALDRDSQKGPAIHGAFRDSVMPIVDAGKAQIISGAHAIDEHLTVDPAPGHSPGHVVFKLASQSTQALFAGDVLHHVIQLYYPAWNSFACVHAEDARASRRKVLEYCAGSGALLAPGHFGDPFVCRVEQHGDAFRPRFGT